MISADWQDVRPETGLTLRQAMLFYNDEKLAERFYELEAQGYGGDPPPLWGLMAGQRLGKS